MLQRTFEVGNGIQYHIVARAFNDKSSVLLFDQSHVHKEVHESLKDQTATLPLIERVGKQSNVLMSNAALEIRIAHLVSFAQVAKGEAIVMLLLNLEYILPMVISIRRLLK